MPMSKPIHLYIKTHNQTGLKYFGKTTASDPCKYKGSGTRWLNHIRVHGYDVTTEILATFDDIELCRQFALNFSLSHNIVESAEWANLKLETLDGGFDHIHVLPNDVKKRWMEEWWNGLTDEERSYIISTRSHAGDSNYWFGADRSGANNPMFGVKMTESTKEKIRQTKLNKRIVKDATSDEVIGLVEVDHPNILSGKWIAVNTGKLHSEETKQQMSKIHKQRGTTPPSPKGMLWWTDGIRTVRSKQSPGPNFKRGRTKSTN